MLPYPDIPVRILRGKRLTLSMLTAFPAPPISAPRTEPHRGWLPLLAERYSARGRYQFQVQTEILQTMEGSDTVAEHVIAGANDLTYLNPRPFYFCSTRSILQVQVSPFPVNSTRQSWAAS